MTHQLKQNPLNLLLLPFSTSIDLNAVFNPQNANHNYQDNPSFKLKLNWQAIYQYQAEYQSKSKNANQSISVDSPLKSASCINIMLNDFYFEYQSIAFAQQTLMHTQLQNQIPMQHILNVDPNKSSMPNQANINYAEDSTLSPRFLQQYIQNLMQQQNSVAQKIETFKAFNRFEFQENHQQANHFSKLNNFENFEVFKNTKLSNATAMQQRIWHFLLHVNDLHCYESLAHLIGDKSCRAVGTAVGKNPFAYLGRCHLILPKQDFKLFKKYFKQHLSNVWFAFLKWAKSSVQTPTDDLQINQAWRELNQQIAQHKMGYYFYGSILKYIFLAIFMKQVPEIGVKVDIN